MNRLGKSALPVALLLTLILASVPAALGLEAEDHRVGSDLAASPSYSGDDAYDPAAGGTPSLSLSAIPQRAFLSAALSAAAGFSGDDAYDPAAGGTPELSVAGLVWGSGSDLACSLPDEEIEARGAWSVEGGFSGDDAYDAAAGGMPELSLLAFAGDSTLLAACEPILLNS